MELNIKHYRQYLHQYLAEAIRNGNRTNADIASYLSTIRPLGPFDRHRVEKKQALEDLKKAFDEHRHWPVDIVISHLGLDAKELLS